METTTTTTTGRASTNGASARVTVKRSPGSVRSTRARRSAGATRPTRPTRARSPQARRSTPKAAPKIQATVDVRTKATTSSAQLDPRTLAFAYLGVGELAVTAVREASGRVIELVRNPRGVQDLRGRVTVDVTKFVGDLASRGERLFGSIRSSAYTRRAMDQSKIARSQVKAATTSVRKAVDTATVAAREAVKKVS